MQAAINFWPSRTAVQRGQPSRLSGCAGEPSGIAPLISGQLKSFDSLGLRGPNSWINRGTGYALGVLAAALGGKSLHNRRHSRPRTERLAAGLADSCRGLRLFLDTADVAEWDRLLPLGFFYGVTTNPVLLQRAGVPCSVASLRNLYHKAMQYPGIQEVMMQAWGEDTDSLVNIGRQLHSFDEKRIVIKLPLTPAGMRAAAELKRDKHMKLCMTTCYASKQGLIAAGLQAEYIAPYLGRMGDLGVDGLKECRDMHESIGGQNATTRVLVASIRSVSQMMELAAGGLGTFTFSPAICDALLDVPATDSAAKEFEQAARDGADLAYKR